MYLDHVNSPLGEILLGSDGEHLTGLWFPGQMYLPDLSSYIKMETKATKETKKWLEIYFSGKKPEFLPSIRFASGSDFRKEVWGLLLQIPYGETVTYGELAKKLAEKMGKERMFAQAVGGAVGHNPISIIVPCHRVVGADGSLTGYAGGIEKKEWLLSHENNHSFQSL